MKKKGQRIAVKSIAGIVLLLVVFSLVVSIIGHRELTDALISQYSESAFHTGRVAAVVVNADRMEKYRKSNGETEDYNTVWNALTALCNSSNSTFIYVIEPDRSDYAHIRFLFSTINSKSNYTVYPFGYLRDTTNYEYREKYRALCEGRSDQELVIRDKGYIETDTHITAIVPLKGSDGEVKALLCVQKQLDTLYHARNTYIRRVGMVLVVLALFVIIGQSIYLNRVLLMPIRQISEEAVRFSSENVPAETKLQETIQNRDEIGQLAESIDQMEEQVQQYVENLTRITAEMERIVTELALAAQIQMSMIPHDFPPFPDRCEFELYATVDPAREVGGDFYDFFLIDEDHLGLVIADVSGKGIPAALFMMASKIILQSCAMLGKSPAEILEKTNEGICAGNQAEMFLTVWLGILEISTGKLTAANAGHEYPAVKHADGRFELLKDKHGFVIGGLETVRYSEYELSLEPGAKIFVYTDGVPEATDRENRMFGTDRLIDALNTDPDACPEQLLKNVRAAVDGFVEGAEQFDDLTMLCMEYHGKDGRNDNP